MRDESRYDDDIERALTGDLKRNRHIATTGVARLGNLHWLSLAWRRNALGVVYESILPGISDRPEQLREVVKAAREAGATGVWTNLLFLRPGKREHFLDHLAEDWPELVPYYQELYRGRAYLGSKESQPARQLVSG